MRGRLGPAVVLCTACGFHPSAVSTDASATSDAPDPLRVTIIDDSAADFSGTLVGGVVAPRGSLEPDVYASGGLHVRGYADPMHLAGQSATYAGLGSALGSALGEDYAFVPFVNWPQFPPVNSTDVNRPRGLHMTQSDDFALLFDGEIYLTAGSNTLQLDVDDDAFFDITLPDGPHRIQGERQKSQITVTPTDAGWYPITGGFGELNLDAHLQLALLDGSGAVTQLLPARLRARTTAAPGLLAAGYGLGELELDAFPGYEPASIEHDVGSDITDLALGAPSSLRFAGQLLIDADGDYAAAVTTGSDAAEGFRLYLDGTRVAQRWLSLPTLAQTQPVHLAAGWHAVTIDYSHAAGSSPLSLRLGPASGALQPVAADHLRPTRAYGATAQVAGGNAVGYGAAATSSFPLAVTAPPTGAAIIDAVDAVYILTGARNQNATMVLRDGSAGASLPIHVTPNELEVAQKYDYVADDTQLAGQPVAGAWQLLFTDPVPQNNGSVYGGAVVTYHGGIAAPFAPSLVYTSPPRATPGAVALRSFHVDGELAHVVPTLQVRVAADAAGLDSAPWTAITDGAQTLAGPFGALQYQLTFTDDGWSYPQVDKVTIAYETAPPP